MTTITLTPDIDGPLTAQANQLGTTPEQLALDGLRKLFVTEKGDASEGETLFDFLQGYVGTILGTTEALSENCGHLRFTSQVHPKSKSLPVSFE